MDGHDAGYPVAGAPPSQVITAATVNIDVDGKRMSGSVTLAAAPTPETAGTVRIGIGNRDATGCDPGTGGIRVTSDHVGAGGSWSGPTLTFDVPADLILPSDKYECLFVGFYPRESEATDVAFGPLNATPDLPVLELRVPRSRNLVKGVPSTVWVVVGNMSKTSTARNLTLKMGGRGLSIKAGTFGGTGILKNEIGPGAGESVELRVTLTGKQRASTLALTVTGPQVEAKATVRVRRIPRPAPPSPGIYTGSGIRFQVVAQGRRRFIVNLRATPEGEKCVDDVIDPDKVVIPANNEVDQLRKAKTNSPWGAIRLESHQVTMTFRGKKVTGYVDERYRGLCSMQRNFSARLTRRR